MSTRLHFYSELSLYPHLGKEDRRYRLQDWRFFKPEAPWGLTPLPPDSLSPVEKARWEAAVAAGLLPKQYWRLVSRPAAAASLVNLITCLVLLLQGQPWMVTPILGLMILVAGGYLLLSLRLLRQEHTLPWELTVAEELTPEEQRRFALALNLLSVKVLPGSAQTPLPLGLMDELVLKFAQERELYLQQLLKLSPEGRRQLLQAITRRSQVSLWGALPLEFSSPRDLILQGRYASERYTVAVIANRF